MHLTRNGGASGAGLAAVLTAILLAVPMPAEGQYFGRNKVQYRTFDFQVLATDHFDVYYYPEEADAARLVARMAERWHARLSRFFSHALRGRQALILYAASSHFRQTNAVEGLIGEGTGGLTEALKRRIVLPMSGSLADTDHVLGHELVHAFQFDITGTDPRDLAFQIPEILQFPLWFVEGMAEYLTLGPVDAQTAMWLRDAALTEKLPHVRDLDHWRYFPYRWGHAFWAYVGARYGDHAVASLIRSAANPRVDLIGLCRQLGTDPDALTAAWHDAIRRATLAAAADEAPISSTPRRLIGPEQGGGRFNVGPRLSPDGRYVAFFSERDRFAVELFLADAATGRVERKLVRSATDPHFDSLEFLSSAGAWSPDGRSFVVTAVQDGRPVLVFVDPASGRVRQEVRLPGLDDALQPAFAPDGRSVVVSGNRGGLVDLYRLHLQDQQLERLTEDAWGDLEAAFTPDGRALIFVTERFSASLDTLETGPLRLARLDLDTGAVTPIPGFRHGKHLSPQVTDDGRTLTFVAEPDGISNVYRMPIDGGPIERLSSFVTGVAGITSSSPALSAVPATGLLAFSVFEDGGHSIYLLDPADVVSLVASEAGGHGAVLPGRTVAAGDVHRFLQDPARGLPAVTAVAASVPYRQGLSLDLIGQPTITAGVSEFGSYVGGSMWAFFSDILGDRALAVSGRAGGDLADLGGQVFYVSRRHRWNWAAGLEATPYRFGYLTLREDPAAGEILVTEVIERQTTRGGFAVAAYPFSTATRLEVAAGARALTFGRERRTRVYAADTRQLLGRRESEESAAPTLHLAESSLALVHDTSYFGAVSPVYGARYRLELGQSLGSIRYTSLLADWRRYFMPVRPVTLAVRGFHFGRYGTDAEHPQLAGLYAGYAEFLHGYGYGSFGLADCQRTTPDGECGAFADLIGSRLAVVNVEARAPLVGLFRGELDYGRVPVEVAAFFDAGLTWTRTEKPSFAGGPRRVLRSVGGAARVNVFGLLALELAASRPLDRRARGWQWQLSVRQGF